LNKEKNKITFLPFIAGWTCEVNHGKPFLAGGRTTALSMTTHLIKLAGFGFAIAALLGSQHLRADSDDGLLARYLLNGDGADISSYGHNGAVSAVRPTADRFGTSGKALLFDGTNSFISVADSPDLRLATTDFTITAWIYESERNFHFNDCIISKRALGAGRGIEGDGRGWIVCIRGLWGQPSTTGRLFYQVSGGEDPKAFSTTALSLNQWHHVAIVYHHASATVDMFIDGAWDSRTAKIPPPNPSITVPMHIGNDSQQAYNNAYVFHGKINDVRVYNRSLTGVEVADLYGAGIFLNGVHFSGAALTRNYGGLTIGQTVIVERSQDLLHWTPIETNVATSATLSITNTVNPGVNAEFFRVHPE
jgi:hypothetical protein